MQSTDWLNLLTMHVICSLFRQNEIRTILGIGVSPDRIIYANPCKQVSHLKYAAKKGVRLMTFDNELELYKVKTHFPTARYGQLCGAPISCVRRFQASWKGSCSRAQCHCYCLLLPATSLCSSSQVGAADQSGRPSSHMSAWYQVWLQRRRRLPTAAHCPGPWAGGGGSEVGGVPVVRDHEGVIIQLV